MDDLFSAAHQAQTKLEEAGIPFCFIGGIAIQMWGEPRTTRDIDVTVLAGFGNEAQIAGDLLSLFEPRVSDAQAFAVANRVILAKEGAFGLDIGLGAFAFEESAISRAELCEIAEGIWLRVCSAEDLLIMKVFAGRAIDWFDARAILVRQGSKLDWDYIMPQLEALLELKESPEDMQKLMQIKDEIEA